MEYCGNLHRYSARNSKNLYVIIENVIHEKPFQRLIVNFLLARGLSEVSSVEEILHHAEQLEKEYDWLGASAQHEKALNLLPESDFSRKGEIHERLGYALYRFAFQAESKDEFRDRLHQSSVAYEKAVELYGELNEPVKTARTLRCDAMIAYIGYWLAPEAKEKKEKIDECWRLTKEALVAFKEAGEGWEYGKTNNQLSNGVVFAFCLNWDFQAREKMMREAVESGEQAIKFLSEFEDTRELARACARTAYYLGVFDHYFLDLDEKQKDIEKIQHYWQRAKELSEDVALFEFLYPVFGAQFLLWGDGTEEALTNLNKAVEYGRKTKDKFIIGSALDWLVYHTCYCPMAKYVEDPEERSAIDKTIFQYVEDALQQYAPISFISQRGDAFWIEMENTVGNYGNLAFFETDLRKKRGLFEKAREACPDGLRRAEASGNPNIIAYANYSLSSVLVGLADLESNSEEKKRLLEEALELKHAAARINDRLEPYLLWNRGGRQNGLAWVKYELADLAKDPETKKSMLQEAILDMENGLKLCLEEVRVLGKQFPVAPLYIGNNQYTSGVWLNRLYQLTSDKKHLRKAAEAFADAAESLRKFGAKNRIAECQWKAALTYDALGEHLKAAENFDLASDNYKSVSERVSQIKNFYLEHASYMAAWSEIEKARHHHERQEYGLAKEHFEKAADLHRSLKKWSYLAPNYCAWASVEYAEDLSRKEQCEEAIQAFKEAAKLFDETKKSIQNELSKIEDADEKRMANSMVKATDMRHEYCVARVALEDAKILDKKGDHYFSSEKYGQAAEVFERISYALETEQERKEFNLIVSLSRAWQKMTLAEAKSSPALYLEASQIFEQAEDLSPNEKAKMLVLGHSRFCKALEAGTRFADSRDVALHQIVEQHLESAAGYYVRAGFQNASEYSKAIEHLFDAYLYMDDAKREKDPEKKARLYIMAEKVLQTSADSFMKAEHPEKTEQVQRLLEKVKEERELALSLSEVLHAPSIVSTTAAFNTPGSTHENAVGLEKFEHADVHANVIVNRNELKVGETLDLEIELANAGKGTALLDKIEGAIPNGFEIAEKLQTYRIEGCNVNMKGRRLEQLKGEDVKLSLRPKHKGSFTLRPVILYLDENGNARSHEPEPILITVKELGISGWLKGEK